MRTRVDSLFIILVLSIAALAQDTDRAPSLQTSPSEEGTNVHDHNHEPGAQHSDMSKRPGMHMSTESAYTPSPHDSSGTGWQPASVPRHEWMTSVGSGWDLMAHGVIFATFNYQGGPRGAGKAESVNWAMLMEQHRLGKGTILFRQMFSAESLTSPHPGFPQLFQTGETYHGEPLVDHQHPHNVFSELSLYYTFPLSDKVTWMLYGGPVGEPALGPVTYMHRASASELPAAPLSHHLQDSTHTVFGVITTGVIVGHFKLEGSAFHGREPNEQRWSIQLGALDSWSGRINVAFTRNWTAQYNYGFLNHPEALDPTNEHRQTASVEYNRRIARGNWATTLAWGRKHKDLIDTNQNSYLLESTLNFLDRNYVYTRMELVDKDELFPENPLEPSYRIGGYTFGAVRDVIQNHAWQLGVGGDVTFNSKPDSLNVVYGNNPVSFRILVRVRPAQVEHRH
jgi:hypothetical protein